MSNFERSEVSKTLYPEPVVTDGLAHPLLWSTMPDELPELDPSKVLTWDDIEPPLTPSFNHGKLLEVLQSINTPGQRRGSLIIPNFNQLSACGGGPINVNSGCDQPLSDFESDDSSSCASESEEDASDDQLSTFDEEDGVQVLERKLPSDDSLPTPTAKIQFSSLDLKTKVNPKANVTQ